MPDFLERSTLFEGVFCVHCGAWLTSGVVAEGREGCLCVCVLGVHESCTVLRSLW